MKKHIFVQVNLRMMENIRIGHHLNELNPNMIDVTKSPTLPT
jgi:hypothetical protein